MFTKLFGSKKSRPSGPAALADEGSVLMDDATVLLTESKTALPPVCPSWQPGDVINERYRVEEVFAGAMGKVYIAEHLGWHVRMAIKSPRPEVLADQEGMLRILREANGWIKLGVHPNIASCYYVLSLSKVPHIFIEYVNGGTLGDWITKGRCRDWRTALAIAIQFCNGMEYTHSQGIIHRDIKPANILLSQEGLVKITDFGILGSIKDSHQPETFQFSGSEEYGADPTVGFRGTPKYASPEQLRNTHQVDQRSDIFSFGLCLWMMFCEKRPYEDNAAGGYPEPISLDPRHIMPRSLANLLKKVVAFEADDRYQSFSELRAVLDAIHQELFRVSCPFALVGKIDLKAENLNNRAVSLTELGKVQEAVACLNMTLEINDTLPEAIYNLIVLNWRCTELPPLRVLRQIESTRKRFPEFTLLTELEQEILAGMNRAAKGSAPEIKRRQRPELRLCLPRTPTEIFREGQLQQSVQENILAQFQNRNFADCFNTLRIAWGNSSFRKEKVFNTVYENLLKAGHKIEVIAAQRVTTYFGPKGQASWQSYIALRQAIVSAGADGRVWYRSLGQKSQGSLLLEATSPVSALAVGSKGGHMAVGCRDGRVLVRSLQSQKQTEIQAADTPIRALVFGPNEGWLLWGTENGAITCYDLETGRRMSYNQEEGGAVQALALIGHDLDFVAGGADGSLRFWNLRDKACKRSIEAHVLPLTALSVSRDNRQVATGSEDRLVRIWDCQSGGCLRTIKAHEDTVSSVLMLADDMTLITGCTDDIIKLWDLKSGECRLILDGRGDGICSLSQGPKTHLFLAGRMDGAIVLWMTIYDLEFTAPGH